MVCLYRNVFSLLPAMQRAGAVDVLPENSSILKHFGPEVPFKVLTEEGAVD